MTSAQRLLELAARLRKGSMVVLVSLLVLAVFVVPATISLDSGLGQIGQDILLSLILLSGTLAVSDRRLGFVLLALCAIVVTAVRWIGWFFPPGLPPAIYAEAMLFVLLLLSTVIGIKVFGGGTVTLDRIWGAVALYMLAGIIWAAAYELVDLYLPGAFAGVAPGDKADRWTWVYFSFSTLTTVGYGDITPIAHAARSLANLEALIGQLYPAIVLARLISLQVADSGSGPNKA